MELRQKDLEQILPYNSYQLCDAILGCLIQEEQDIKRVFTQPVRDLQLKEMQQAMEMIGAIKRLSIKVRKDTTFYKNRKNKGNLA